MPKQCRKFSRCTDHFFDARAQCRQLLFTAPCRVKYVLNVVTMCQHLQEVQVAALRLCDGRLKRGLGFRCLAEPRVTAAKPRL